MRFRLLSALLAAVLACAGLSACRTNIGLAANIDGHKVTETDVNSYLTRSAQPVQLTDSSGQPGSMAPRSYVVDILIEEALFKKVAGLLGGHPTDAGIDAEVTQALGGASLRKAAEASGLKGFTSRFYTIWGRTRVLENDVRNAVQGGADIRSALKKLTFPISVNPRYGSWDKKQFAFTADQNAGIPAFVHLVSGTSTTGSTFSQ